MQGQKLSIEEVAVLVGSSYKTIQTWYTFKKQNPDNELAKLLPDFEQAGPRKPRYWNREDIWKLIEFKNKLPKGRNGVMGSVTRKYYKTEVKNEG